MAVPTAAPLITPIIVNLTALGMVLGSVNVPITVPVKAAPFAGAVPVPYRSPRLALAAPVLIWNVSITMRFPLLPGVPFIVEPNPNITALEIDVGLAG